MRKKREHPTVEGPCPNCEAHNDGRFCVGCGQKLTTGRLNLRELLGSLIGEILEFDLPILRTVVGLTINPGVVCREFIEGRRRRYTNPLKYAILIGALFVAVLALFDLRITEGVHASMTSPASTGRQAEFQQVWTDQVMPQFEQNSHYLTFLMLPVLAVLLLGLYTDRRYTYAEHCVFLFYTGGHLFWVSLLWVTTGWSSSILGLFAMSFVVPWLYHTWAAVKFYKQGWLYSAVKMLAFMFVQYILSMFVGFMIAIIAIVVMTIRASEEDPAADAPTDDQAEVDGDEQPQTPETPLPSDQEVDEEAGETTSLSLLGESDVWTCWSDCRLVLTRA